MGRVSMTVPLHPGDATGRHHSQQPNPKKQLGVRTTGERLEIQPHRGCRASAAPSTGPGTAPQVGVAKSAHTSMTYARAGTLAHVNSTSLKTGVHARLTTRGG